ncbi:MAG: CADD family putative folate metabolism protein [Chloroflexi bacterium]|nr:CADD family putative folate metabolism protein [Chloroflexota bacterium]
MKIGSDLEVRIKQAIEAKSLLDHPFYKEWTAGTLSMERLREYARQYYHFELAFPRFLSAIHTRADSPRIRQLLLDNLWDEEHGERNHPVLWLEFAAALGLPAGAVTGSKPNRETAALIEHFTRTSHDASVAEALATLFAYEGQVPGIAWQKIRGLTEHYGFAPEQFEFFSVHLVADISHAGAEVKAIEESCTDAVAVVAATEAACDMLLAFLDGCYAAGGTN